MSRKLFAAVETGGTKILCRIDGDDGAVAAEQRFVTSTPEQALADVSGTIASVISGGDMLSAIGMASFGPVVVDPLAGDYGRIPLTPKPHWSGSNLRRALAERFDVPVALDTDVNAAALAEAALGAGRGVPAVAYVTVGTGIGGGLVVDGAPLHGALHPEIGHLRLHRAPGDAAPSACPFHADCAEGLTSGPALQGRLRPGESFASRPDLAPLTAGYLAELCEALLLCWAPGCIVLGGGVLALPGLLQATQAALQATVAYGPAAAARKPGFLRAAHLENAGLEGALLMARRIAA